MLRALRITGLSMLWLGALIPIALWITHLQSPTAAVRALQVSTTMLAKGALGAAVLLAVGLLLFPPLPAGIRLLFASTRRLATSDRTRLQRAWTDLQQFETAQRHLDYGRLCREHGQPKLAILHLQRALELDPSLLAPRYEVAQLLFANRQYADALPLLGQVVQLDPGHAFGEALLLLGRASLLAGNRPAAAQLLQHHQRVHGGNRRSHFWLADALDAVGDRAGARAALQFAAAPPPARQRLTAEENWFRARARVALWRHGGAA